MLTTPKTPHALRPGDLVHHHGGVFLIVSDPVESQTHRPEGYWPQAGIGPSACVVARGVCLTGTVPGYFAPGSDWSFQGNHLATYRVQVTA